jgi:hypothetical protein
LSELTIELLLNHFDFIVAVVSVDVFQHHTVVIPPLVGISFQHPQQTRKYPQMDVVSMLYSKDVFVPCRNLSFGNRLSLTAMEKAGAAFTLWAGFMPNSPMPMLDVCDWLLLMTVSTTGGGSMFPAPFLVFGLFLLSAVAPLP